MLYPLTYPDNASAVGLFSGLDRHLVLASIFAGKTPAIVYVDDPNMPRAGFTWFKHRAFLGGTPEKRAFLTDLAELLSDDLVPAAIKSGCEAMILDFHNPAWQPTLDTLMPGQVAFRASRQYYTVDLASWNPYSEPRPMPGFEALQVDGELLARCDLANMDKLRQETCSERVSIEDFLKHSFGVCLTYEGKLAAWCLSEYNVNNCCEVGVATQEIFQRQGLGNRITGLLLSQARAKGYRQVGWHSWARNEASGALARKAGLHLQTEFEVNLFIF